MKKRVVMSFAIVLVLLFAVTACSVPSQQGASGSAAAEDGGAAASSAENTGDSGEKKEGNFKVGIIPMTLNDNFQVMMSNAAKAKAEELGMEATIQGSTEHVDAEDQLQYIETMIANGYDAILISPSATEGLLTAIKKCQDAGVVLINMDAKLNAEQLEENGLEAVPHYGSDNYEGGKKAGAYVAENFEKGTKTGILLGIEGHDATLTRTQGFKDAAGDVVDIVSEQTADFDVEKGYTATQNMITANPDIQLIYAISDGMGIGAARAIEEAGLADQIKVVSFDGIPESLQLVQEGKIEADVAQDGPAMGMLSMQAAYDALQGNEIEMDVDTGTKTITKDKVDEYLEYLTPFM